MSVNPVSHPSASASPIQNQGQQKPAATPQAQATPQQDAVHLSSQAKAAAGDVDHDGDSH
jgi:hypothetical protein